LRAAGCLTRCIVEEITQAGHRWRPSEGSERNTQVQE
jgi:hypothetical protein